MDQQVDVTVSRARGPGGREIVCTVETLDSSFSGLDATVSLVAKVVVHDSRPVNKDRVLHKATTRLGDRPVEVRFSSQETPAYSYRGRIVDVQIYTRVVVDDAIIFDTKIDEAHDLGLGGPKERAAALNEPGDAYDFDKNLQALSGALRTVALTIRNVGWGFAAANLAVALHDGVSDASADWFYVGLDGLPTIVLATVLSGLAMLVVHLSLRFLMKRYLRIEVRDGVSVRRGRKYTVGELIEGRSRVPLRDVELSIVVGNTEHGQYRRSDGTTTRTVQVEEPTRSVEVFRQKVDVIPSNQPIGRFFSDPVDFEAAFASLYPQFKVTRSHGVGLFWVVFFLHPEFRDHRLEGPSGAFVFDDFLESELPESHNPPAP